MGWWEVGGREIWASPSGEGSGSSLYLLARCASCGDAAAIPDAALAGELRVGEERIRARLVRGS